MTCDNILATCHCKISGGCAPFCGSVVLLARLPVRRAKSGMDSNKKISWLLSLDYWSILLPDFLFTVVIIILCRRDQTSIVRRGGSSDLRESFWANFSPLFSCRSPQAALKFSYRSDRVPRY